MTAVQYVYKVAEVVKVTDGDTYWLRLDTRTPTVSAGGLGDLWTETPDGSVADHLGLALASQKLASAWPTRWREVYDTTLT